MILSPPIGALALQAAPLLVAPVAALLAKAAEEAPAFPYEGRTKAGIVAALVLASLAARVALAWATGTLGAMDWRHEVAIALDALAGAGVAAGGYALVRASKPVFSPAAQAAEQAAS